MAIPYLILWTESVSCECIRPLSNSKVDSGQPQVVREGGADEVPAEGQVKQPHCPRHRWGIYRVASEQGDLTSTTTASSTCNYRLIISPRMATWLKEEKIYTYYRHNNACVCMYVTLHRMCSNIVVHTLYIAVSVIHKFHSLSIATLTSWCAGRIGCFHCWISPMG